MIAVRITIQGVVQGVGFRWHTRREAQRLGLTGWVCNRPDGTVEAHLEGPVRAVDEMLAWLGEGPPSASVEAVDTTPTAPEGLTEFEIRK